METQVFKYEDSVLHFSKFGNGTNVLIAFHGFGQDHQAFSELRNNRPAQYTVFSFDIFFHGKSVWNKGEQPLQKSFWKELMSMFLIHHKIDRFSVLGFSMGGKFALACLELFPEKIESIFLVAPDGIKISPWYTLATSTAATRQLFKSMIVNPKRFQFIANLSHKLGLIDKGILRFVESQMSTQEKREQVYYSWVVFRRLKFDMNLMASHINSNNISLTVIIGKYDKIFNAQTVERLLKKVKNHNLEILETGHTGLISKLGSL